MPNTLTGLLREIASYIDGRPQASAVSMGIKASEAIALAEEQERQLGCREADLKDALGKIQNYHDVLMQDSGLLADIPTCIDTLRVNRRELERQLAALLAEIKALPCYPGCGHLPCSRCFLVAQLDMRALDAHDERLLADYIDNHGSTCDCCQHVLIDVTAAKAGTRSHCIAGDPEGEGSACAAGWHDNLDAHDERVRMETLESAANVWAIIRDGPLHTWEEAHGDVERWLRDRANGGGNV